MVELIDEAEDDDEESRAWEEAQIRRAADRRLAQEQSEAKKVYKPAASTSPFPSRCVCLWLCV
jgi:hypothetical protein